jgi:hypothetical protein
LGVVEEAHTRDISSFRGAFGEVKITILVEYQEVPPLNILTKSLSWIREDASANSRVGKGSFGHNLPL